jgi:hypothetical protein
VTVAGRAVVQQEEVGKAIANANVDHAPLIFNLACERLSALCDAMLSDASEAELGAIWGANPQ